MFLIFLALPALVVLYFCIWLTRDYLRILRLRQRLPPGPFPLPLLGNYIHMRQQRPWEHWEKLGVQYNAPMLTLWNGHRPVLVCNDAWVIADLFEKRANIYSSRPRMVMMGDMTGQTDSNQVSLQYNDQWRLHRKITHGAVGSHVVKDYRSFQSDETKILLRDLMETPEQYVMSIERYSCSVVSIIAWARRINEMGDYVAQQALLFMENVNAVIPGQALMEIIPALAEWPAFINPLPASLRKFGNSYARWFFAMSNEAKHAGVGSFSDKVLKEYEEGNITWKEVGNLTGNLVGGGVDTTSSSMISMILAMCCFPRVQRKAYEEIMRVVGPDRLPNYDDELPYIDALVNEVLRWRTVTILGGIPHAPVQDDEYNGFFIPKDTWILGNVWAIHRNPRDFPEPDEFRPERFLDEIRPYPCKKGHNAFGWGRRQCSGQPLAEQGLRLVTARLIWAFEMAPGLDDMGNEIIPNIFAYTASENMRPEAFRARFIPRSESTRALISWEAVHARANLAKYDGETKLTLENISETELGPRKSEFL